MTSLAESLIDRIVKQRDLVAAMDDHCKSVSARVTSRDRNVSVEVDGYGAMTGLWLGPNAHKLGADAVAKLIVATARAAAQVAADRQEFLSKEFSQRMDKLRQTPLTRWDGNSFVPDHD